MTKLLAGNFSDGLATRDDFFQAIAIIQTKAPHYLTQSPKSYREKILTNLVSILEAKKKMS